MEEELIPLTLTELKELRRNIQNTNVVHKESFSGLEKLAVKITDKVGSMGFFIIIFVWTVVWLSWNIFGPEQFKFDPFPSFVMWLFISNMIQIFLMPLIMVGQNLQGRHSEARAEADFEINMVAEKEVESILLHVEKQAALILQILQNLEARQVKN